MNPLRSRRSFLRATAGLGTGALAGLGDLGFLGQLQPVSAAEARVEPKRVRLDPGIEPLVRLLEETPRERILEEVGARLKRGLSYRELLTALFLAAVRNIQPRPIGFKFHAVLVVHSAHLASLSASDTDRWLPIFWAIDQFKSSQAADVKEGDWELAPVEESAVPAPHRARQAFVEAMDNWDEAAADAAIVGLVRSAGAHEIFELLCRYGVRDFREIGHKAIYIANSFRALESIGWHHAEPVLRSVAYALLDRVGDKALGNPAKLDLPADRPFRRNLENRKALRADWLEGKPDPDATVELLHAVRQASAAEISELTVRLLNRGAHPQSIFNGIHAGAGELLMQAPGILSLHATTFTNAVRYAWQHVRDEDLRRLLLLQNAAFLPLFRGNSKDKGIRLDQLEPEPAKGKVGIEDVFAQLGKDRLLGARQVLALLQDGGSPGILAEAARRLIFLKGRDAHDYKFSSAVFEDYHQLDSPWRERVLAASMFYLRTATDTDNPLVQRTRAALGA